MLRHCYPAKATVSALVCGVSLNKHEQFTGTRVKSVHGERGGGRETLDSFYREC